MQILQGRQALTDLPLLHAAKVQMGINHVPWPTAEILCVKDKLLSSSTNDIPIGQNVKYREPNDKDGIQQLLSNSYQRRDHTSSEQMTMLLIEKCKYI